eukprot:TRINITY_DN2224_c0_g2_i1.p1 TRINITY_DN2224_c0_g2~~TRINITY_DN2224_c0_g2_i1.p1  ORF type:complete len:332 (+),score=85.02 TRINITY_DN2224_c0_g2_i1:95-997(+)
MASVQFLDTDQDYIYSHPSTPLSPSGSRRFRSWCDLPQRYLPCLRELRPQFLKMFLIRVIILGIFFIVSLWLMSAASVIAGIRYPKDGTVLPDLGFEFLPSMLNEGWITNTLLYVTGSMTAIRIAFNPKGLTIVRRMAFVYSVVLLGRATTLVATNYPDASPLCKNFVPAEGINAFLVQSFYKENMITCGDLMYSGHAIYFTLQGLIWSYYSKYRIEGMMWMVIFFSIMSLVTTHVHYTADVMISFYITVLVWYLYHVIATRPEARRDSPLIYWLEKDIAMYEEKYPEEIDQGLQVPCAC